MVFYDALIGWFCNDPVKVISGNHHECPVLYELVEQFVKVVGRGMMKRLILDIVS